MHNYNKAYNNTRYPYQNPQYQAVRPMVQKNLNLTVDPLSFPQKNHPHSKRKNITPKQNITLTLEQGEQLLNTWRETNFVDFNSWIQIAKAQMNTEIFENGNEINKAAQKTFNCNLTLTFDEDPNFMMIANGFARNKKDAKKMAIEKIIIDLIQNGEISRGIRSLDFISNIQKRSQQLAHNNKLHSDQDGDLQRKIHKLSKKMQDLLKVDKFLDACEAFCEILAKKKPDWNELAFIWSYAIMKKDFSYVKAIIDMIQYKRVQPTLNSSNSEETKSNEDAKDSREELAKRELMKKYGNCRMKSDNPYDILDVFNMEVNLPEIDTRESRVISDEEAIAEILKDPLAVDIAKLFIPDSNGSLPFVSLIEQLPGLNNSRDPSATFSDAKVLNSITAEEANKLLHQLNFNLLQQQQQSHPTNIRQTLNNQYENNTMIDPYSQQDLNQRTNMLSQAQGFMPENSDYGRTRIDLRTSKEIKDPSVNYIPYKLLNEFYESLLYIPDLNFALSVAEVIYTRIRLDDDDFINNFACLYYSNKKNMLMIELIESIFQPVNKTKNKLNDTAININGTIEKVGNKFAQEVLVFSCFDAEHELQNKILKKGGGEGRENYNQIGEGEFVLLTTNQPAFMANQFGNYGFQNQSDNTVHNGLIACVREVTKDYKIKLFVLPNQQQSGLISQGGRPWNISKLTNRTSIDKTAEALETFCTQITMAHPLLQILLSPPICNNNFVQQLAETKVLRNSRYQQTPVTNLNESQQKALNSATSHLLTLIQGPPGTGKTTTAVEIVLEWLRASSAPILACADSNVAVDLLYQEFMQAGIKAVRIGANFDENNDFRSDKQYAAYAAFQSAKQYHNANGIRFNIIKRKISEAQVVCATCVGTLSEYLKPLSFPRIIMDEVTQANELATLIPLIKGCQQLVLVGDHKQLPPTVISTFAQSKGMTISLFERLVKQGVQPHLLDIQYRMHPSISEFPSYKFYNSQLQNGIDASDRQIVQGFDWPSQLTRVAFINVKGNEQVHASSIQNSREVEVVVEVFIKLLAYNDIRSVGIITPYDAQRKRLRNEINLQAKKYPTLFGITPDQAQVINRNTVLNDIDTVDGYQGMERDVIIFSAVRCNKSGSLGFLRDPRRLNVTLTRAKRGLIVVGNLETLIHDPNWKDWVQWCKTNKVILHYK